MTKDWEKRFDDYRNHLKWCDPEVINDRYKSFIRIELAKQKTQLLARVRIERIWAMPNKWTFTIKPIKELLEKEISGEMWIDPFAGFNSPATMTNDLDKNAPTHSHTDALEFLKKISDNVADGVLYDPPYSITQARQYGKKEYASMKYWKQVKDELARILKKGGKAVCFGWSSMGLGKSRGFEMNRILLVPHGGSKNDTIVTVEIKKLKIISKEGKE